MTAQQDMTTRLALAFSTMLREGTLGLRWMNQAGIGPKPEGVTLEQHMENWLRYGSRPELSRDCSLLALADRITAIEECLNDSDPIVRRVTRTTANLRDLARELREEAAR